MDQAIPGELDVCIMRLIPVPILASSAVGDGSVSYSDASHRDSGVTVDLLLKILDHPYRASVLADTWSRRAVRG